MKRLIALTALIASISLAACGIKSTEPTAVAQNSSPEIATGNVASNVDDHENGEGGRPTKPIDKTEYPAASAEEVAANLERLEKTSECRGCNFARADLSRVAFYGKKLDRANFYECDLSEAGLSFVSLEGANFRNARLYRADLTNSNLSGANLAGANLMKAQINQASLVNADLRGTDLTDAILSGANIDGWLTDAETLLDSASLPDRR